MCVPATIVTYLSHNVTDLVNVWPGRSVISSNSDGRQTDKIDRATFVRFETEKKKKKREFSSRFSRDPHKNLCGKSARVVADRSVRQLSPNRTSGLHSPANAFRRGAFSFYDRIIAYYPYLYDIVTKKKKFFFLPRSCNIFHRLLSQRNACGFVRKNIVFHPTKYKRSVSL